MEGGRELRPTIAIGNESEILTFSTFKIKEEPQDIDEDGWYVSTHCDSDSCVEGASTVEGLQRLQVKFEQETSKEETSTGAANGTASDIEDHLKIETVDEDGDDRCHDEDCRAFDAKEQDREGEPISCRSCHKAFWNIAILKEHMTSHHMGEGSSCSSSELDKSNESISECNENEELYCGVLVEGHHSVDIVTVTSFQGKESQGEAAETCSLYSDKVTAYRNRGHIFDSSNRSIDSFCEFVNIQATLKVAGQATSAGEGKYLFGTPSVKPYPCELCPKSFPYKRLLQSHYQTHKRQAERKCPFCQRTFTRVSKLNHHIETHNGQKCLDEAIRCHICQKTFSRGSNLNRHVLIHSGEKSFRCEMCDRSFSDKSSLRNHQYTHTKEKAFRCEICGTRFKQKRCLVRHVANQHHDQESNSS